MMKIVLITLGFSPYRTSGFDVAGEHLVQGLLDSGHQVIVIAGKKGDFEEDWVHPNLLIYRIQLDKLDWFSFSYRAARLVRQLRDYDIVHFFDVYFSYAYKGPYVASLHHSFRQRLESLGSIWCGLNPLWLYQYLYYSFALHFAEKPGLRDARGLLAVSRTCYSEYLEHYQVLPEKIVKAKNCIDTNYFRSSPIARWINLRHQLKLSPTEHVILFAGFITPRKGLEYLARALPAIEPLPKLVIIGRWRSPGYRQNVLRLLQPVIGQVVEAGFIPDEQMPDYYSLADVYVSSSLMEGFGLPLGEALACETPVVAFDAGATAEVVGPGGILVPPRDVDGMAKAVSFLLQNPEKRKSMGEAGRQHVIHEFSVEAMLKSTLEAYERFLGVKE